MRDTQCLIIGEVKKLRGLGHQIEQCSSGGFGDKDFDKPIIGVANGHSNLNPCNAGIQPIVDRAMKALETNVLNLKFLVSQQLLTGIGMGTEGMKYSLVSRELLLMRLKLQLTDK